MAIQNNKKTISRDTKVTLTIRQLTDIVSNSVKNVLQEYLEQGLLGNPEAVQLQEQNELLGAFMQLQENMQLIGSKLGMSSSIPMSDDSSGLDNSNKFDRVKNSSMLQENARRMMSNNVMGGRPINSNTMGMQSAIPPQQQYAVSNKIEQIKQSKPLSREESSYLDILSEIPPETLPDLSGATM